LLSSVLSVLLFSSTPLLAAPAANLWSLRFGGANTEYINDIAVDAAGNIHIVGQFNGTVNLGGANLVSAGLDDIFIAKYNAQGVHLWSQKFGSTSSDAARSVAVAPSGRIYVTGSFVGSMSFGGAVLNPLGGADIFLAMYESTGAHVWSVRYGNTLNDVGACVVATSTTTGYLTGSFSGLVNFGLGNLGSAGAEDIFLLKFNDTSGTMIQQRFGGSSFDNGNGVAVDSFDNPIITGYFINTVNFGGGNIVTNGIQDVFVAKYDAVGNLHMWSRGMGGTNTDNGRSVAVDGSNNVIVTGSFRNTGLFGGVGLVSAGMTDIFVAKYDGASGAHTWSQAYGGTGADEGAEVGSDAADGVLMTGYTSGTVDLGGGPEAGFGNVDIALLRLDSAGAHQWSVHTGSPFDDGGASITTDTAGRAIASGSFFSTIDLGSGPMTSAGNIDTYIAMFGVERLQPAIDAITDIGNDQGRQVRIDFARSGMDDALALEPVTQYEAYRRNDPPPASSLVGAPSSDQLLAAGWTQVGTVDAHAESDYSIVAPTVGDSTVALGPYHSVYYIRASTAVPATYYDSPPDSGYSLDNLAPGIPSSFVFESGELAWDESSADDFDFFTVYGSNTDNFGAAVIVDYTIAAAMDVSASPYVFYYVTATDFSGNEGKPARVNTLSNAGGTPKRYVLSVSNYPNPFNPRTTVSYTVPSRGHVSVRVYDTRGAHVATLVAGEKAPGAYTADWNPGAAISSGVYFARIEHGGSTRTKKMVLLK
jgi:hypothetical protein